LLGGYRLPRKLICLAVCTFSWRISDFAVVPISLAATPPRTLFLAAGSQGNLISLLSILGGFCLAASCQGSFPWRFCYIPWRFLAAKAIPFSGSVLEWGDAAGGGEPKGAGVHADE